MTNINNQVKHTEGIWSINELTFNTHQIQIYTRSNGALSMPMYSGQTQQELNDDARFIVTACNNYDALVEALKSTWYNSLREDCWSKNRMSFQEVADLLSQIEKDGE
jgi:hypothetical protein